MYCARRALRRKAVLAEIVHLQDARVTSRQSKGRAIDNDYRVRPHFPGGTNMVLGSLTAIDDADAESIFGSPFESLFEHLHKAGSGAIISPKYVADTGDDDHAAKTTLQNRPPPLLKVQRVLVTRPKEAFSAHPLSTPVAPLSCCPLGRRLCHDKPSPTMMLAALRACSAVRPAAGRETILTSGAMPWAFSQYRTSG